MPIPKQEQNEDDKKFVQRCMSNETMKKDYPDNKQRVAICIGSMNTKSKSSISTQVFNILKWVLSDSKETKGKYEYFDPLTQEVYYFNKLRDYHKDGRKLIYRGEAS